MTIELRSQVHVAGSAVTLGEVAALRTADLGLIRTLVALPIGRAPAAGQNALVQRTTLAAWIRRHTGLADDQLAWQGPEATRVGAGAQVIPAETIALAASAALRERLAADGWRGGLEVQALPRDIEAGAGAVRLQARPLAHVPLRERMVVWVEVWVGSQFLRAVPVSLQVDGVRGLAPIAAPIAAPLGFAAGAGAVAPLDAAVAPGAVAPLGNATAYRAAPPVAAVAGAAAVVPLDAASASRAVVPVDATGVSRAATLPDSAASPASAFEPGAAIPAVQRGQWASLRSGAGAVVTEARVEVLQDGRLGDSVRVRQPGAASGLIARVTGPGQLEVAR